MGITLKEGNYPCNATISIDKDGKAVVIFDTDLGLKNGDKIQLKNQPEGSAIRIGQNPLRPQNETAFI
jgi:hypothetical protein